MRLLDRYLVRQFISPLVFAFLAMTSIMLLNQVARRFGALVGKGLPWSVIGEVFLLCLPFIIAMTLPMAVLVAMLYTFSHLAADSEITAMRASGLSVGQLVRPMVLVGVLITAVNFWFTDQVLPESNARLRNLLINIQRKKPTLELREQVINEIPPSGLFLRASRIDPTSGRLRSVTIYDMAGTDGRRVIYADSGVMGFTEVGTDLQLKLFDGSVHAFRQSDPSLMQITDFTTNTIRVRDVSNRLDLEANDGVRGDREMTTCEMMDVVGGARYEVRLAEARRRISADRDLRALLVLPQTGGPARADRPQPPAYCRAFAALGQRVGTASGDSGTQSPEPVVPSYGETDNVPQMPLAGVVLPPVRQPGMRLPTNLTSWAEVSAARDEVKTSGGRANQYLVEVHKKWAISVACLVFALVGIPMALRFPRGGMGLVIGGGLGVFAIYYVGLIAGEGLGNKNIVPPWLAMWAPNLIFVTVAIIGIIRVGRESGSTRGGDLTELWENLTGRFRRQKAAA
ncbi:MAG: LptF/LptG family permease [Gemmatimonadetes bacterium]|nr:LptF/LptG family permease [Gemmatimonadota bacterium]